MTIELRARSQITIPKEIINNLGLNEGDKFDICEKDGGIFLCPVVIYPKAELRRIAKLIRDTDKDIKKGKFKAYDDVDKMFEDMGIKLNEE